MSLFARLDDVHAAHDILRHPFYRRWSSGELTPEDLATYAREARHAIVALADVAARAAESAPGDRRAELDRHAAEEAAHVALWDDFAAAVGADGPGVPAPETASCVQAWTGGGTRDHVGSLVALHTIESPQPRISETKAEGLARFYGIDGGARAAYFTLHAEHDHVHAAEARHLIEQDLVTADEDALVADAESILRGYWTLLDGVERLRGRRPA